MNRLAVVKHLVSPPVVVKHLASPLVAVSLPADVTADVVTNVAVVVCFRTCSTRCDATRRAANLHADVSPLAVASRPAVATKTTNGRAVTRPDAFNEAKTLGIICQGFFLCQLAA